MSVMSVATLLFSGRSWLWPALVFVLASLFLLVWSYRSAPARSGTRALCFALKLLGLAALAACLLEPLWSRERAKPGANYFALLADNSQGMQIKDRGAEQTRGEQLRKVLTQPAGWLGKLDENFQLRRYSFDTRLQSATDFSELHFDGRSSSLISSLRTLADRFKGQPLAGVLVFSDGNATDLPDGAPDLSGLPPIYPVVIGTDDPIKDIALQKVTVSQTAFEDAPVTIQAEVSADGYAGERITAQLLKVGQGSSLSTTNNSAGSQTNRPLNARAAVRPAAGQDSAQEKFVAEQTQRAVRDGQTISFRFQVKPEQAGLTFYQIRVSAKDELDQFKNPKALQEATLANNVRVLAVDRGRGPYRILYVSGRPNWEYKFLHRALAEDDQVELVGLIRIARREPKFEFRGRAGESSNPLFRGFGTQSKEEIERYDQPVLIRLNTRDEFELRGGFPKTPEDLYSYHAVIVDDLESEFFKSDQMTLVQKFVSERGGGFLMLGGAESFYQGKYYHTPIGDMLPVYLDQGGDGKPPGDLKLDLTREGWLQPWARLRNNEPDERDRLKEVPPFGVLNKVRGVKPGASVIATATDGRETRYPALVVQRFGNGRVGALLIGDLWHWGLKDEANHRDMDKAWRQLIRWLVADVPNRLELQVQEKRGDPNQAVELLVRARDKKFQPLDNATASVTIRPVGTAVDSTTPQGAEKKVRTTPGSSVTNRSVHLPAEAAPSEAGVYQTTYVPRETGGYFAEALVTDASGMEIGRAQAGWSSDPAAEEFRSLKPNRALMESIARKTGGEMISASALDSFARKLPNRKAPITEQWTSPLWHQAGVFLFALLCFVAEWGIRRWKGLA
jgi:uncharacterized membrane protein